MTRSRDELTRSERNWRSESGGATRPASNRARPVPSTRGGSSSGSPAPLLRAAEQRANTRPGASDRCSDPKAPGWFPPATDRIHRPDAASTKATIPTHTASGRSGQADETTAGECTREIGRSSLGFLGPLPRVVHSAAASMPSGSRSRMASTTASWGLLARPALPLVTDPAIAAEAEAPGYRGLRLSLRGAHQEPLDADLGVDRAGTPVASIERSKAHQRAAEAVRRAVGRRDDRHDFVITASYGIGRKSMTAAPRAGWLVASPSRIIGPRTGVDRPAVDRFVRGPSSSVRAAREGPRRFHRGTRRSSPARARAAEDDRPRTKDRETGSGTGRRRW
jgi:hypothetical protein